MKGPPGHREGGAVETACERVNPLTRGECGAVETAGGGDRSDVRAGAEHPLLASAVENYL